MSVLMRKLPRAPLLHEGGGLVEILVNALQQYDVLTDGEKRLLSALPIHVMTYGKGSEIVRQGERPDHACIQLDGFAARALLFADGRRQITSLHIPGDFVDLQGLYAKHIDHSVIAFGNCTVGFVPHAALRQLIDHQSHLMHLLWLTTLVDAAIDRAWIACLGRRFAVEHLGHFLCELFTRMRGRGLTIDNAFAFSATQIDLADVLGMSPVHVNRTLQGLRRLGHVTLDGGRIVMSNLDELAAMCEFDPAYLNQRVERR